MLVFLDMYIPYAILRLLLLRLNCFTINTRGQLNLGFSLTPVIIGCTAGIMQQNITLQFSELICELQVYIYLYGQTSSVVEYKIWQIM